MTWIDHTATTGYLQQAFTNTPNNLALLRAHFRGPTAPTSPVAGQRWDDTTTGTHKVWDGSAWEVLGPLDLHPVLGHRHLALTATTTTSLIVAQASMVLVEVVLYPRSATTSDVSNKWVFQVQRDSDTTNMLSTAHDTDTGSDLAATTALVLTVDQNATLGADTGAALVATKTGAPGDLSDLLVQVRGYEANP